MSDRVTGFSQAGLKGVERATKERAREYRSMESR